jgi:hypothetical protein
MKGRFTRYIPVAVIFIIIVVYSVYVFLSDGTVGGADDMTHYRYSRYAFQNPYFFIHHWGKPFFTALTAPFAQFGWNGVRIFNVLAGAAAAWFTFRTAKLLGFSYPLLAIFMVMSSPLYVVLMLSGMTEILFSLVLILAIYLFFREQTIWSALLLSFLPFVRTEGVVIFPLFLLACAWNRQWKAIPFMAAGFVFYSIAGSFHFNDILWVIHEMPYKGNTKELYGSGDLLHYVNNSKYIFGLAMAFLMVAGLVLWAADPFLDKKRRRKEWLMEMLVVYMPFIAYLAAHSYVWWKGLGNSVGLIRVIAAIIPSAALLATMAYGKLMDRIPVRGIWKQAVTAAFCIFLVTIPYQIYKIPVPLDREQKVIKEASNWLMDSEIFNNKIYYYDPFWWFFLDLNPCDEECIREFVYRTEEPEYNIKEGEIVLWDAHYSPNEGALPLENLMDQQGFKLVKMFRPEKRFRTLGGYEYEIYIFQRILKDDNTDNYQLKEQMSGD